MQNHASTSCRKCTLQNRKARPLTLQTRVSNFQILEGIIARVFKEMIGSRNTTVHFEVAPLGKDWKDSM